VKQPLDKEPKRMPVDPLSGKRSGYIPTLDGWRAIAILIVMLDHSATISLWHFSTFRFHYLGDFGVRIFFALSGLLITSRLLDEESITGGLHLKGFYIRRVLRIQPVALLFLATVSILTLLHRLPANWDALLAALLFVRNIFEVHLTPSSWPTSHFWSLSVEEQFYLFLPAFLVLVKRRRGPILLTLALLDMGWFLYGLAMHDWVPDLYLFRTDYCVHFLILAAALAVFLRNDTFRARCARVIRAWWVLPLTLLMIPNKSPIHGLLFLTPCLLVMSTVLHPHTGISRAFEWKPVRFLGRISYSLYIWQALFFSAFFAPSLRTFGDMDRLWLFWPCVFITAYLSYRFVEKPFMRLGHRVAHPATAGRPELAQG
jgi:peptidoglycan/LPS O-acetylase OafA/YrhL